jgi:hypothetical protein
MLGRRRGVIRILAVTLVVVLPAIAAVDLSDESLWGPQETFDNRYDLIYTTLGIGASTQTVDSTVNMGPYTSLELDQWFRAHISYYDETNGDLKYARQTGSGWAIEIVDSWGDVGLYTSLALDSNYRPHISYYRKSTGDLRYAWHDGSVFHIETVDDIRDTGLYTSLALDKNSTPYISYYEKTRGTLKLARLNGTGWTIEELDDSGDVGLHSSLALDFDDYPHISYYDKSRGDLKFIEWNGTAWGEARVIDSRGDVGLHTSLALAPNGRPHVSYYDKTRTALKFAVFGDWFADVRTIDDAGNVGMYTSLVLDSIGRAHISYYDWTNGNLKWARGSGFDWMTTIAHDDGDTGPYSSIEVDSNDDPCISFAGPSFTGSSQPAIGMDCDGMDSCTYVHMVWVETEEIARSAYERIYYQRSSDGGKSWEIPVRPISSAWRHPSGPPIAYVSGPPSISVVGSTVHVVWVQQYPGGTGVFYQRSEDNGDTWLPDEVRIDDTPSSGFATIIRDSVDLYADEDYINVVWQDSRRIFSARSLVSEADTPDGWRMDFGKYSSLAVDQTGRVFITSWDESNGNLLLSGASENGAFGTKIIDRVGNVGQHSSVALDPSNYPYPRIAYYDQANGNLKYAGWNGTDWTIHNVDTSGDVGQYASLQMDSGDRAHIAYYDVSKGDLKYARWGGSAWSIETVDDLGDVGKYASLKLDGLDYPHISYYNATKKALKIASWNGSEWSLLEIDSGDVGMYSSLDLDSNDLAHISYYDEGNRHLKYVYFDGSDWNYDFPDETDDVGQHTSMALDSSDEPYICYYDSGEGQLKYARLIGQNWLRDVLDTSGNVGTHTSMALDRFDNMHISYYDETNKRLKYYSESVPWRRQSVQQNEMLSYPMYGIARQKHNTAGMPHITGEDGAVHVVYEEMRTPKGDLKFAKFNGTDWTIEIVDTDGLVGVHTSMKLDSNGYPHIAYYDQTWGRLKYARWNGTAWTIEVVDDDGDVGAECSLALDSKNHPHIAYMDVWNGPMKYAWWDGSEWNIELVGTIGLAAGLYNSLALDSMDHPHIAYYSWANIAAKYVYFDGREWTFVHVDSRGWQQISLALDSNDRPHLGYIDRTELALAYTYWDGSGWVKEIVDESSPYVGTWPSIALTKDDEPVIVYYDENRGDLRYARPQYPASNTARIDYANRVGMYNSMALDDYGVPHVSFYDYTEGDLKYAKWVPGGWNVELIDNEGDVGLHTSIDLDRFGYPHISYYDESNGNGLLYTQAPASGNESWTPRILINEKTRTYLYSPQINVIGEDVHAVWSEYDESTGQEDIYYKRSEDGGASWIGPATKISDDMPPRFHRNPQLRVSGATVHVMWERRESIGVGIFNSEVLYDSNRHNGDPSGWGPDIVLSPNPPVYSRYMALWPYMMAVGNDLHLVWSFWNGVLRTELEYIGAVDDLAKIGGLGTARKGSSSVYVLNPSTLRQDIVLIGGDTSAGFSDNVTLIDPHTGTESNYCNLPTGLAYSSVVWDGKDSVFIFGGLSGSGALASILRVNLTTAVPGDRCTDTGITFADPMYGTSAVYDLENDTAYIFGGIDGTGTHRISIVMWPRLGIPANFGIMPSERAFTSAVWVESQKLAYVFGGVDGGSQLLDEILLFNPDSMIPEARALSFAKLPSAKSGTSAVYDGTYAYIIGGQSANGSLSGIVRFNPNGDWESGLVVVCPELPMGLENSSASISISTESLLNGIFVIGGSNETAMSGYVWRYVPSYWSFEGLSVKR